MRVEGTEDEGRAEDEEDTTECDDCGAHRDMIPPVCSVLSRVPG